MVTMIIVNFTLNLIEISVSYKKYREIVESLINEKGPEEKE